MPSSQRKHGEEFEIKTHLPWCLGDVHLAGGDFNPKNKTKFRYGFYCRRRNSSPQSFFFRLELNKFYGLGEKVFMALVVERTP